MLKNTIMLMFLTLGISLKSQVSFYLRPSVNVKTNQGNIFGSYLKQPIYTQMSNKYFSINTSKMYLDLNNINFGIQFGLQLKNKHFFEIGMSNDNSGIKTQTAFHSLYNDLYQSNFQIVKKGGNHTQNVNGSPFLRISLAYNNLIYQNKSNTLKIRTSIGIGTLNNRFVNRKKGIYVIEEVPVFPLGQIDTNIINSKYSLTSINAWRNSLFVNVGLGADFYLKSKKYLFSFDLLYLQGN